MKLAIISDVHDNLANLERFLKLFAEECSPSDGEHSKSCGIICCGDVTTPETLEFLVEKFEGFATPELGGGGMIKLVCGNAEIRPEEFSELAKRHPNLEVFVEVGEWHCAPSDGEQISIAFVHRPEKAEKLALRQAQGKPKYHFVFYGHTHKPWIKGVIANPGTLGGGFTPPTFAILDTETGRLELKKLY